MNLRNRLVVLIALAIPLVGCGKEIEKKSFINGPQRALASGDTETDTAAIDTSPKAQRHTSSIHPKS